MLNQLLRDEAAFIISAEMLIIMTLVVCGVVVGFVSIRDSLVGELHDVSEAIGAVSQSYNFNGLQKPTSGGGTHGRCSGSGFNDDADDCDCQGITFTVVAGKSDPSPLNVADGI